MKCYHSKLLRLFGAMELTVTSFRKHNKLVSFLLVFIIWLTP
jgi:hypothetical protein